ncbi:MAG: penicillin-binding protein 2 [Spirochaetales bacterium]|jgi:penicillin-binding protein 2|nr:penicillin-binding protein 2 [Spirochaetales bacterium]
MAVNQTAGPSKARITALFCFFALLIVLYTVYLYSMQIVNVGKYLQRAAAVSRRVQIIPAQRGEIYDRNFDVPLVMNTPSFAVDIIPGEVGDSRLEELFRNLGEILEISPAEIADRIPPEYYHLYEPIEIKDSVDYATIVYLAENIDNYPGVNWHDKPKRSYPESGSVTHILGYVGNITPEELQVSYNLGYQRNSIIGKAGVERRYDQVLMGQPGARFQTVDVRGRSINASPGDADIQPQNGQKLVLTIDRRIQELAEKALGDRMGSVVVLKPNTGEILAMVSYPWYDPNIFYTDQRNDYFNSLVADNRFPFINRAISSSFAPASTFKVLMTTAVLGENAFPLNQRVLCAGEKRYGDRVFHCHVLTGHGSLTLEEGLAQSCNIFFYTMGQEYLGIDRIVKYGQAFGLGQLTGIDLAGESPGILPSPLWKEEAFNARWVGGDTLNTSIGQGYLSVTPLQAANLIAMVVNEGVVYRPHVLKEIRDPLTGAVLEEIEPEVLHRMDVSGETFRLVKDYMRGTITNGTARWVITTRATEVAGKTGTGEVGLEDQWSSWFCAYAPYQTDNPDEQVVVVVHIDGYNTWEWWAPKAADMIFQGIFARQTFEEVMEEFKNRWYILELNQRIAEAAASAEAAEAAAAD